MFSTGQSSNKINCSRRLTVTNDLGTFEFLIHSVSKLILRLFSLIVASPASSSSKTPTMQERRMVANVPSSWPKETLRKLSPYPVSQLSDATTMESSLFVENCSTFEKRLEKLCSKTPKFKLSNRSWVYNKARSIRTPTRYDTVVWWSWQIKSVLIIPLSPSPSVPFGQDWLILYAVGSRWFSHQRSHH